LDIKIRIRFRHYNGKEALCQAVPADFDRIFAAKSGREHKKTARRIGIKAWKNALNGGACKRARRGTGGEKRVRNPRQSRSRSQAHFVGGEIDAGGGRRAEKAAFKGTFWKNGGGKEGFFRQMRTKGIKRAKNAQNRVERTMRESGGTGQRNENFKRREIAEAEFICRGRNPLGVEKKRKDDFYRKNFRLERDAGVIFFEESLDGQGTRFFVREEKSGGAEKKRNLYLFSEEGGRSVQGGKA